MKRIWFLALILCGLACPHAHAQKTVLVTSPATHLEDLSADEIQALFTGNDLHLKAGVHAVPVLLQGGPTHDAFLKEHIGKTDAAFRIGWRSLVFSGQATMPHSSTDEADLVAYLAHTPGAVGYIAKSTPHDNLVVLRVR